MAKMQPITHEQAVALAERYGLSPTCPYCDQMYEVIKCERGVKTIFDGLFPAGAETTNFVARAECPTGHWWEKVQDNGAGLHWWGR